MGRGVALALAYCGGVLFLLAGAWTVLGLEFICFGGCAPSDVPSRVLRVVIPYYALFLLPGIVAMVIAWIICLVLLQRAQWRGWFRNVLFAPVLIFLGSANCLIIVWSIFAQTSADYRTVAEGSYPVFLVTVMASILLTLVSDLIVIVAGHALSRASLIAASAPGRATAGGRRR